MQLLNVPFKIKEEVLAIVEKVIEKKDHSVKKLWMVGDQDSLDITNSYLYCDLFSKAIEQMLLTQTKADKCFIFFQAQ